MDGRRTAVAGLDGAAGLLGAARRIVVVSAAGFCTDPKISLGSRRCLLCYDHEALPQAPQGAALSRIINNSNNMAVQRASQVHQQHHQVIEQNRRMQMMQRQNAARRLLSQTAPPEEGQTVEYDVTSLGLEVRQSYTIKEAVIGGGFHQFELIDAEGNVRCVGGGDRDDALLQIAIWLSEGEGPDDVAPEDRPDFN